MMEHRQLWPSAPIFKPPAPFKYKSRPPPIEISCNAQVSSVKLVRKQLSMSDIEWTDEGKRTKNASVDLFASSFDSDKLSELEDMISQTLCELFNDTRRQFQSNFTHLLRSNTSTLDIDTDNVVSDLNHKIMSVVREEFAKQETDHHHLSNSHTLALRNSFNDVHRMINDKKQKLKRQEMELDTISQKIPQKMASAHAKLANVMEDSLSALSYSLQTAYRTKRSLNERQKELLRCSKINERRLSSLSSRLEKLKEELDSIDLTHGNFLDSGSQSHNVCHQIVDECKHISQSLPIDLQAPLHCLSDIANSFYKDVEDAVNEQFLKKRIFTQISSLSTTLNAGTSPNTL